MKPWQGTSWALYFGIGIIAFRGFIAMPEARAHFDGFEREKPSRIQMAIEILERTPSGKEMIGKSLTAWKLGTANELLKVVKSGEVSRTDAVLTRHYDPETGAESRDREVTIYINDNQSLVNMILDLAHEMVHATSRPSWDPYDPKLTPGRYIQAAIDGEGGEVQAVAEECRVALELSKNYQVSTHRCQSYLNPKSQKVEIEPIRRDFYRVGKWHDALTKTLGTETRLLPALSKDSPELYSSTGNAPYPVALLKEYEALTQIACENSRHRASSGSNPNRSPAQEDQTALFLERRCR
jgi:hypothetical protein